MLQYHKVCYFTKNYVLFIKYVHCLLRLFLTNYQRDEFHFMSMISLPLKWPSCILLYASGKS